MVNPLSLLTAQARYGVISNGIWSDEAKWCKMVQIPEKIGGSWINTATNHFVKYIYCNIDMADKLLQALKNIEDARLLHELKTFDGCFNIRDIRGSPGKLSSHSYGLSIDINAFENPLGSLGSKMSEGFVKCWVDADFKWGAYFPRPDPMHFTIAGW